MIRDPLGLEGMQAMGGPDLPESGLERPLVMGETAGLGMLPLETDLERDKVLSRVEARNIALPFLPEGLALSGYEIHQGRTRAAGPDRPALRVIGRNGNAHAGIDGYAADGGLVSGCYLHGIFESPEARAALIRWLMLRKGLDPADAAVSGAEATIAQDPLDRIADRVLDCFDPVSILPAIP